MNLVLKNKYKMN